MSLLDNMLTLREAHRLLELNGVDWHFGWFRTQVFCGKIPSQKILTARAVDRADIMKIIKDYKLKKAGLK